MRSLFIYMFLCSDADNITRVEVFYMSMHPTMWLQNQPAHTLLTQETPNYVGGDYFSTFFFPLFFGALMSMVHVAAMLNVEPQDQEPERSAPESVPPFPSATERLQKWWWVILWPLVMMVFILPKVSFALFEPQMNLLLLSSFFFWVLSASVVSRILIGMYMHRTTPRSVVAYGDDGQHSSRQDRPSRDMIPFIVFQLFFVDWVVQLVLILCYWSTHKILFVDVCVVIYLVGVMYTSTYFLACFRNPPTCHFSFSKCFQSIAATPLCKKCASMLNVGSGSLDPSRSASQYTPSQYTHLRRPLLPSVRWTSCAFVFLGTCCMGAIFAPFPHQEFVPLPNPAFEEGAVIHETTTIDLSSCSSLPSISLDSSGASSPTTTVVHTWIVPLDLHENDTENDTAYGIVSASYFSDARFPSMWDCEHLPTQRVDALRGMPVMLSSHCVDMWCFGETLPSSSAKWFVSATPDPSLSGFDLSGVGTHATTENNMYALVQADDLADIGFPRVFVHTLLGLWLMVLILGSVCWARWIHTEVFPDHAHATTLVESSSSVQTYVPRAKLYFLWLYFMPLMSVFLAREVHFEPYAHNYNLAATVALGPYVVGLTFQVYGWIRQAVTFMKDTQPTRHHNVAHLPLVSFRYIDGVVNSDAFWWEVCVIRNTLFFPVLALTICLAASMSAKGEWGNVVQLSSFVYGVILVVTHCVLRDRR